MFERSLFMPWQRASAWTPLIVLLLMGLFSAFVMGNIITCEPMWIIGAPPCLPHIPVVNQIVDKTPGSKFAELSGRLTWAISMLFFTLTITATFTTIVRTINNNLGSIKQRLVTFTLFFASGVIIAPLLIPRGGFKFNQPLLAPVYEIAPAERFVTFVQIMAPLALVGLAIAASLTLFKRQAAGTVGAETNVIGRANALAHAQKRIRVLLYLGAIALVAGTLQSSALYAWATTMLDPGSYYAKISDIPQTMGILNGSFYSIFLAGIFVPAIAQLRRQAFALAEVALPDASEVERKKWVEQNAIEGTLPRQLLSALAVSAPLLAGGPLVSLLESLAS